MKKTMTSPLKELRQERKLSQRQLSRITGVQQTILSRIERGEMSLLSPHAEKISRDLDVPISRLLGITSNVAPAPLNADDDIRSGYDFSDGVRGKYAAGDVHIAALDEDVHAVFPDSQSVNEALRILIKIARRVKNASKAS